jgi:hypothetical protein
MNTDLIEAINDILNNVADNDYEGWNEYWDLQLVYRKKVIVLLNEWKKAVEQHQNHNFDGGYDSNTGDMWE